ncbi:MAG TPA: MaoC/PaaZ C-terminal domain-containing protein [Chloroflexota bacterium]|nr:MaoC/PaaZ C-terminal domain-containing protein [Chloroflexota bacterium]
MIARGIDAVEVGQSAVYETAVLLGDVFEFASLSGDHHPQHTDAAYASATRFGERIAHGALLVAYMSAAFTQYWERWLRGRTAQPAVSYGYDRVRFIKPVRFGDRLKVEHRIARIDAPEHKAFAEVTVTNQQGETVAAATHIVKFV